jgi:hypothetical protein
MRKNAANSTSQPDWVVRGTHLRFSPDTAIKAMRLSQAPVDGRLLGLPGPYHRHVIGTFNTCLRVPTPRSLTDTGGGYHIENLGIATTLSRPPLLRVPLIPLMAPPNLRLSIQHLPIELQREQALNLTKSHEWVPPLDFYCNLPSKHNITNGKPPQDEGKDNPEGRSQCIYGTIQLL